MLIKEEPVYELELAPRRDEASARAAHLVLHGALDLVDRAIAPASAARATPHRMAARACATRSVPPGQSDDESSTTTVPVFFAAAPLSRRRLALARV